MQYNDNMTINSHTQINTIDSYEQIGINTNELMQTINEARGKEGKVILKHYNFIKKLKYHFSDEADQYESTYTDKQNRERKCYLLPKDKCLFLAMRESVSICNKVIAAFNLTQQHSEQHSAINDRSPSDYTQHNVNSATFSPVDTSVPNFNNPVDMARAWANEVERKQKALSELCDKDKQIASLRRQLGHKQDNPVKTINAPVNSANTQQGTNKGFRTVCKILNANETNFRSFLKNYGYMYLLDGEWMPKSNYIARGLFVIKTGTNRNNDREYSQAMFTPKGVTFITEKWNQFLNCH